MNEDQTGLAIEIRRLSEGGYLVGQCFACTTIDEAFRYVRLKFHPPILKFDGHLSKEQADEIRKKWESNISGYLTII